MVVYLWYHLDRYQNGINRKEDPKMDKELKVIIQNVLKYEDKENKGKYKSRLGYFLADSTSVQNTDKFKGIAELSIFTDNTKLFDSLRSDHMGKSATLKFIEKPSTRNPLKTYLELKEICFKDETIGLL